MLKIEGKPIIENTIKLFRKNGVSDISVIKGYKKEKINFPGVTYFENDDFENNNQLYSLMYARDKLDEAVKTNEEMIISFSDILYSGDVLKKLIEDENPIAAVVDIDWYESYIGRTHHPVSEADNVIMDKDRKMIKIGKNILPDGVAKDRQGEFIGLWKFNPQGISIFLNHFDRLDFILNKTDPFEF